MYLYYCSLYILFYSKLVVNYLFICNSTNLELITLKLHIIRICFETQVPIEKLAMKVEELTQERSEKLTRVKLAEKERDALEGPMKEAIEFLQAENKVIHYKNNLLQKYM